MRVLQKKLTFAKGKNTAEIGYGACWHIGNPSSSVDGIENFLEWAKTHQWWHAGDIIEAITKDDGRDKAGENECVLPTIDHAGATMKKRKATCWGLICGNHEYAGSKNIGSISESIARKGEVPYLGMTTYFDVKCPKGNCLLFSAHGAGSMGFNSGDPQRDDTNRQVKLRRILRKFDGDLKCIAHYHRTIIAPRLVEHRGTVEDGAFKRRPCIHNGEWCVACPSLFRNYHEESQGSYAEMKLYPPTDIGWIGIVLNRDGSVACVREYDADGIVVQEVEEKWVR